MRLESIPGQDMSDFCDALAIDLEGATPDVIIAETSYIESGEAWKSVSCPFLIE